MGLCILPSCGHIIHPVRWLAPRCAPQLSPTNLRCASEWPHRQHQERCPQRFMQERVSAQFCRSISAHINRQLGSESVWIIGIFLVRIFTPASVDVVVVLGLCGFAGEKPQCVELPRSVCPSTSRQTNQQHAIIRAAKLELHQRRTTATPSDST